MGLSGGNKGVLNLLDLFLLGGLLLLFTRDAELQDDKRAVSGSACGTSSPFGGGTWKGEGGGGGAK